MLGDPVPVRVAGPAPWCGIARRRVFPLPSHAAAAGVSLDIWPASHSAPAAPRVVRLSGHDRDRSPSRTTRRATTWFPPRRSARQARSLRASAVLLAVSGTASAPRATAKLAYRCLCDASDRVRCCFAARHWCSSRCCYHTPGSSSRQRRQWRPVCAGHLSTASSRWHQHSS